MPAAGPLPPGTMRALIAGGPREVRRLNDMVARFLWERQVPPDRLHDVQLVVEELVTNITRHGVPERGRHRIAVELDLGPGEVGIAIEDNCQRFDPTTAAEPVQGGTLETRQPGGLGLRIVRRLVTGLAYRRLPGGNRTEARVPLNGPPQV
jgi:serine/threonine-protein kinase RsbW